MQEIIKSIEETLAKMGVNLGKFGPGAHFARDLDMESLLMTELAAKLQRRYGIPLKKQIINFTTVEDLAAYIAGERAKQEPANPEESHST